MAAQKVWVNADPYDHDLVCAALESGADAVVVPQGHSEQVKRLGLIGTVAPDGDLRLGEDVVEVTITDKASERRALEEGQRRIVIVHAADWTVIPLENLIAEGARLVARVFSAEEAILAATTMERGVEGVLLVTHDPAEIRRTVAALKSEAEQVELQAAQVSEVRAVGMGDRVCVDTCTNMGPGEGMLVGNSSAAMFLVHAECVQNPYVACRPFRVNAGAVHGYVRVPGDRTRYLSELESGDEALIVGADGSTRATTVGRAKTERRPLLLVRAQAGDAEVAAILQNAETIRLVRPGGDSVSVVELKSGDEVLVALESAGRHFGVKVQETIQER